MRGPFSRPVYDRLIAWYALACTVLMILWFVVSRQLFGDFDGLDRAVLIGLRRHAAQPGDLWVAIKRIMLFLTMIGSFPVLAILILAVASVLVWARRGKLATRLVLAAGSGMAAANLLKMVVGRARPEVVPHWIEVSSLSYPSGHTSNSSIAYFLITMVAIDAVDRTEKRRAIGAAATVLVILIGISRVYLGVHWPTDVQAGWVFGSAWVALVAPLLRKHGG